MKQIIMMRGLPASGKSTVASALCTHKLVARVNRDLLREMFNYGVYSGKNEKSVVSAEITLVKHLINSGIEHVIIDDCNLNPANEEMWRRVADGLQAKFSIEKVDTDVETCILRDQQREKSVGADVINNMAIQYGLKKVEGDVVVCDIDGTIADIKHRLHYVKGEKKDWMGFFSEMDKDTVREEVYGHLQELEAQGKKIIFVTARPDDYKQVTEAWLRENVPLKSPFMMFMRRKGDTRDDTIVKEQIYNTYLKDMNVTLVIDDRPKVIRMWEELGLEVMDVGSGVEF